MIALIMIDNHLIGSMGDRSGQSGFTGNVGELSDFIIGITAFNHDMFVIATVLFNQSTHWVIAKA